MHVVVWKGVSLVFVVSNEGDERDFPLVVDDLETALDSGDCFFVVVDEGVKLLLEQGRIGFEPGRDASGLGNFDHGRIVRAENVGAIGANGGEAVFDNGGKVLFRRGDGSGGSHTR